MKIEIKGNTIEIKSPIVTLSDVEKIINILSEKEKESNITLNIKSFSLPSTIIGKLIELNDHGVKITLNVYDDTTYELLDKLKLTKKFKIRKV